MNAVASPRANGRIERFNRTILDALVAYVGDDQNHWEQYIPKVQLGLNSNTDSTTGKVPLELLYGFRPRLAGDLLVPICSTNLDEICESAVTRSKDIARHNKITFDIKKNRPTEPSLKLRQFVLAQRKILTLL